MALATLTLAMTVLPLPTRGLSPSGWMSAQLERCAARLEDARIDGSPRSLLAVTLLAPPILFLLGWLQSPVAAAMGALGGFILPRLYVASLARAQRRRGEAEAPRLSQLLVVQLSADSTYLDALRQARTVTGDRWIRGDLDYVVQRFLLDVPLEASLREIRSRVHSPNLGLVWETLALCCANRIPTQTARTLFAELASTFQFNTQLANEVRARSSGQRLQIWLLAIIVPGTYLYLRLLSPELLSVLDETALGRYVLFPAAVLLEVMGLYLSFRISRFEA